jgi:hypothetical protein
MTTRKQKRSESITKSQRAVSIEKYDKVKINQLRQEILTLKDNIENSYFELARRLYVVYENDFYKEWGYKDFEEYCQKELNFSERKGRYLVSVWRYLVIENQFGTKELEMLKDVGWTKMRTLIRVINKENLADWIEQAKKLTADELNVKTKQALLEQLSEGEEVEGEIVKEVKRFSCTLVDDQIKVVDKAFEIAEKIAKSDKKGYLLTLICLDFLSTKTGIDNNLENFIAEILQKVEDHNKA